MNYKVSLIIPTFNRSDLLEPALKSLVGQEFSSSEFEIIIIDNGSTDNTRDLVNDFIEKNKSHTIRYFYDDIPGLLTGRHRGAKEAEADILCFLDDDIEAKPNWLEEVYKTFNDQTVHLVGGKCLPKYDVPPPKWEKELWTKTSEYNMCIYYSLIDQGDAFKDCDPNLIWGLFFAIRKQTLYSAGGFHADVLPKKYMKYLGDGETGLTMKIKELGLRSVYQPKAVLSHHVTKERLTVEYLEKRQFYQGCCDSYTEIRKNNGIKINIKRKTKNFIKDLQSLILLFSHKNEINKIKYQMEKSYKKGFSFHQKEAKKDTNLVQWFLKDDYFDYRLPL